MSVNFVERQALLCGFSIERIVHDYGIDVVAHTYDDDGQIEPGRILMQLKASDNIKLSKDKTSAALTIEMADLRWWIYEPMPVIIVLYDSGSDCAYWLHIQGAFSDNRLSTTLKISQQRKTIQIPLTNKLDLHGFRQIADLKNNILAELERANGHEK